MLTMESMNGFNIAADNVLPHVVRYFHMRDLLEMRMVSKTWNDIISTEHFFDSFAFKVCDKIESISTFSNLSPSFRVKHFRFEGMDLENDLFVDADVFRRFSKNHCLNMISLAIHNCDVSTGRFYELLAFCKKLQKLTLRNVPHLYKVDDGIGIFHWAFCFQYVRENLANLKSLLLYENNGLSHRDVWGLVRGMTSLKSLQIQNDVIPLPIRGITEALKNCSGTLKVLTLRGKIMNPGLQLDADVEMRALLKLNLLRSRIDSSTVKQLQGFLTKCPKLETLRMQYSKIEKMTLSNVQQRLIVLDLYGCDIDDQAFEEAEFKNLNFLRLHIATEKVRETCDENSGEVSLLKCKKPNLVALDLQLPSDGANYLKFLDAQNYSALKSLTFANCQDIAGRFLRKIFRDFTHLTSLSIINCKELTDENVCCAADNNAQECLANLKSGFIIPNMFNHSYKLRNICFETILKYNSIDLKTLNLAGSSIGNQTIKNCFVELKQLEKIHLDNTKVDREGLVAILCPVTTKLAFLKTVTVRHLKISIEDLKNLAIFAPNVKVGCQATTF